MNIKKQNESHKNVYELLQKVAQLEEIIYLLPGNIFWKSADGVFEGCNNNVAKILHLNSPREIIGKRNIDLFDRELAVITDETDRRIIAGGKEQELEERGLDIEGKEIVYLTKKKIVFDPNGGPKFLLGVSIDITDRKEAEKLRIKNMMAAEQAAEFAHMIAGCIAHELRTPLAAINIEIDRMEQIASSQDMSLKAKDDFNEGSFLKIKNIIKGTVYVIDDILLKLRSFSSGEKIKNCIRHSSILTDINNFLDNYPFAKGERDLVIFNCANDFDYIGDPMLTKNVFSNLLNNALRAIKEAGKGKISIDFDTTDSFGNIL